ncbi:MAG: hypothetical protein GX614_12755 [Sandaracinaceae bacterium]|nr:hypothetical protein [Sandaracinaceae bacterium]
MTPRHLFILNSLDDPKPTMTTTRLIRASLSMGFQTFLAPFESIEIFEDGSLHMEAVSPLGPSESPAALLEDVRTLTKSRIRVRKEDRVFLRTNPARIANPSNHRAALELLSVAESRGLNVLNSARGLLKASSKLYLELIPDEYRLPQRIVQSKASALEAFDALGDELIIKPLEGSRGVGVLPLHRTMDGLGAFLELALSTGPALLQPRLRGAKDVRVVLLDGEPFTHEGDPVAIERIPMEGEHRANLHQGGKALPTSLTPAQRRAIEGIAPRLRQDGLRLVGLDFLGDHILELNVFAPGGLRPFETLHSVELGVLLLKKMI